MHVASHPCCPYQVLWHIWDSAAAHALCLHSHLHLRLHQQCALYAVPGQQARDSSQLTAYTVCAQACPLSPRCDGGAGARPCSWACCWF